MHSENSSVSFSLRKRLTKRGFYPKIVRTTYCTIQA